MESVAHAKRHLHVGRRSGMNLHRTRSAPGPRMAACRRDFVRRPAPPISATQNRALRTPLIRGAFLSFASFVEISDGRRVGLGG